MNFSQTSNQQGSIHVFTIALVVLTIVVAIGYLFWANILKPQNNATGASTAATARACEKALDIKKCTLKGVEYTEISDGVYIEKSNLSDPNNDLNSLKYDAPAISKYLDDKQIKIGLLVERRGPTFGTNIKGNEYFAYGFFDGVTIEQGLLHDITVDGDAVTINALDDSPSRISSSNAPSTINKDKAIDETKIMEVLVSTFTDLDADNKDKLLNMGFSGSKSTLDMQYVLMWSHDKGLFYHISMNASTMELDAATGKVLSTYWDDGIKS